MIPGSDIKWCKMHHARIRIGGTWAVPRSGMIFKKTMNGFTLISRMPWTDELEQAARDGANVPKSAEELAAYQE